MNALMFSIFNGALYGLLLFMLSSGLTLIFSMMGVLNLAHSSLFMLGAYFAYSISTVAGFYPAALATVYQKHRSLPSRTDDV